MIIRSDRQQSLINRAALLGAAVFFVLTVVSGAWRDARAAASAQAPAKVSEVMVYTAADEYSQLIETVRDAGALSPIAETTGPDGVKWFMVKTRSGNVGWIKAGDNVEARKIDDHFRALPRDPVSFGPSVASASSEPEPATKTSATGAITIPVKINGPKVGVPVTFSNGNSSATGYLALDTGAAQTMVSKRIARDLRLLAIDSQPRIGIGGSVTVDVGLVESIKVGEAEVKNMRVSIHDRALDLGFEGLLGFDFLGRFQMSVDSEKQLLVLTPRKK
jgi:predicted aspartyl protease